jgi:hypothetical protein
MWGLLKRCVSIVGAVFVVLVVFSGVQAVCLLHLFEEVVFRRETSKKEERENKK